MGPNSAIYTYLKLSLIYLNGNPVGKTITGLLYEYTYNANLFMFRIFQQELSLASYSADFHFGS